MAETVERFGVTPEKAKELLKRYESMLEEVLNKAKNDHNPLFDVYHDAKVVCDDIWQKMQDKGVMGIPDDEYFKFNDESEKMNDALNKIILENGDAKLERYHKFRLTLFIRANNSNLE